MTIPQLRALASRAPNTIIDCYPSERRMPITEYLAIADRVRAERTAYWALHAPFQAT